MRVPETSVPPFALHLFDDDVAFQRVLARAEVGSDIARVRAYANSYGTLSALAEQANKNPPTLRPWDAWGQRLDEVDYHPAYHGLMTSAVAAGLHSLPWTEGKGGHVLRAGLYYMHGQIEAGTLCPITMTCAAHPTLRAIDSVYSSWRPRITSGTYDPRFLPASEKRGCLIGMCMTERQGGSDVRSNTTRAEPAGAGAYALSGQKWFCSAPMSDAFLVLAQAPRGLSCFLLPRFRPDGSTNALAFLQLKDKLGNRSNASAELELTGAYAELLGDEGAGVRTIMEMVALTRFDCVLGSAALMRQALAQALHHCTHRVAFGKPLIEQPLMRTVLADLALESEAAMTLAFRMGSALDAATPADLLFIRLATAAAKYLVCKRAVAFVNEAQECLGGAGYVETSVLPRLYREAPLNSIWEGCGNVQCLDVLRTWVRSEESMTVILDELRAQAGHSAHFDGALATFDSRVAAGPWPEADARYWTEQLAWLLLSAALWRAQSPIAPLFCALRLGPGGASASRCFGGVQGVDAEMVLRRAYRCGRLVVDKSDYIGS